MSAAEQSNTKRHQIRLDFETPHFLHSLIANDQTLLKVVEEKMRLKIVTRNAWLLIIGEKNKVAEAKRFFENLEKIKRQNIDISRHLFQHILQQNAKNHAQKQVVKSIVDDILPKKSLRVGVAPRSETQSHYLKAIKKYDFVFGIGAAGSGKTYLAVAQAVNFLKNGEIKKIILSRPAVESGESLGYLPGDLQEKINPYLRPLYDALEDILGRRETAACLASGEIEIAPLAYMRGRTLNNACVILDEAQNASQEQMLMFLTRVGENSRAIITGDTSQIDLKPHSRSGLLEARNLLRDMAEIKFIIFKKEDIVRHPTVAKIIEVYEKRES